MARSVKTDFIFFCAALLLFLAVWLSSANYRARKTAEINSYEACVQAGYSVLESFPEQCRTPDGRSFNRELTEAEKEDLLPPPPPLPPSICEDKCGDGACQDIVCQAVLCPCAETKSSCPDDCPEKK
ncbi:MAG: hypothetical protein MUC28_02015 [Planctomycetes bacterium]|jgi:hypothetical protein|nr:hypothetical protein [Planctomycetota bacterium]